ncbi:MAG: GNAT family N-acetyltransferase [Treponema sp.]|nr:GNAT family N-acetyltransferase [Treponema sp.]
MDDPESYLLRDFAEADFGSLSELWTATGIGNPARGDSLESVRRTLGRGGRLFVLALEDRIVGSAWVSDDGRRLYLHHMAVLPELQGRGLGKRLLEAAVSAARERGMQMKLEVSEANAGAIALYRKYGFETLEGYRTMIRRRTD